MEFRDEVFAARHQDVDAISVAITDARHPRNVRIFEQKMAWLKGIGSSSYMRMCHSLRINEIPNYEAALLELPDKDLLG